MGTYASHYTRGGRQSGILHRVGNITGSKYTFYTSLFKGYVTSVKGHGGGWSLVVSLTDLTLLDIHSALGESSLFTIGLTDEHTRCPIEIAVNKAIDKAMTEAETLLLERFKQITLDQLAEDFAIKSH